MRSMICAVALVAALPASVMSAVLDCPDDGRLKGVRIGSKLFRDTVYKLPGHACMTYGPNGAFLVTPHGVKKIHD
jgi:hypothetical protein